jgi:hypothetical protein
MSITYKSFVIRVVAAFLLMNLIMSHNGGPNAGSRYAMSLAVGLDQSFQIDKYYTDLTADWSQTSDGHFYSNKAPLPALLGGGLIWILNKTILPHDRRLASFCRSCCKYYPWYF